MVDYIYSGRFFKKKIDNFFSDNNIPTSFCWTISVVVIKFLKTFHSSGRYVIRVCMCTCVCAREEERERGGGGVAAYISVSLLPIPL